MLSYVIYNKFESERNYWFINELIKSFKNNSIELKLLIEDRIDIIIDSKPQILYDLMPLELPRFVLNRTNNYILARQFESIGIKVFNNSNVSYLANNKYLSYLKIATLGIPVLKTDYISKNDIDKVDSFPKVIKSVDGKGGNDVYLCNDEYELRLYSSKIISNFFIVQDVASEIGKDLRVYILGNKIYKSILRTSKSGFKSNYCLGNKANEYELMQSEIELVNKIVAIDHFDYVGIDFLFNDGKVVFNEIEDSVGARMLYDVTDLNVAHDFSNYICSVL